MKDAGDDSRSATEHSNDPSGADASSQMKAATSRRTPNARLAAIAFAVVFPTIVTLAYFVWLDGQPAAVQQGAYSIGKVIQFGFPAVWVFLVLREPFARPTPSRRGVMTGAAFGLAAGVAMIALALLWLKPAGFFDGPGDVIRAKIAGLGLNTVAAYAAVAVFYSAVHSLLEEYYWRWFVFTRTLEFTSFPVAVVVSSLGFMAHHVVVLGVYFGWSSSATYLFSACIAVGGAMWAWVYHNSESIIGPWVSHLLVDAAIFIVGYDLTHNV